ncbi:Sulfite exporter TauE/SafE [uncultured archaeon]|nr:Sulfite exporter TauE/SafE [uncultured archaeon]
MSIVEALKLISLGLLCGFLSATLGIGGGVILVPALVFLLGYHMKKAVSTSLSTIIPTTLVALLTHYLIQGGHFQFLLAALITLGALFGAKFGAQLVHQISTHRLTRLFSLLLIVTGLKLAGALSVSADTGTVSTTPPLLVSLGLATGTLSALFGVGGGVIVVPALNMLFGLPLKDAMTISLLVILPTACAGVFFHRKFNNVDSGALKTLVPAAALGAVIGTFVSPHIPADALKQILGFFLVLTATLMIVQHKIKSKTPTVA